jgi:hypothetical protein
MMSWLDSSEDASGHLRGSIGHGAPAELKSESLLGSLSLLVICAFLAAVLVIAVMHLWRGRLAIGSKPIRGPIQVWRLKRRVRLFATDLHQRLKGDIVPNERWWHWRRASSMVRRILGRPALTQP